MASYSWELKGKGMYLKGWGNVWARWSKGNFLKKICLHPYPPSHKFKKKSFGNLNHQLFTKDLHSSLHLSQRLQRGRKGIKQGISSNSSIPGKYSKTLLLHIIKPNINILLSHLRKGFSRHCNCINSWETQLPFTVGSIFISIPAYLWQGLSWTLCKIGRIVLKV